MIKKYVLRRNGSDISSKIGIYPDLSPRVVQNKELILDKGRDYNSFFPKGIIMKPLIPKYLGDFPPDDVESLSDMPGWIEKKPRASVYPISKRFEDILRQFKLPVHRFYKAEVLYNEESIIPFSVLQLLLNTHYDFIDFKHSVFYNWNRIKEIRLGEEIRQFKDVEDMMAFWKESGWRFPGFEKAVMKPTFREVDILLTLHYGLLISERLKNAIEAAGITGVEIVKCPTVFEIAEEGV